MGNMCDSTLCINKNKFSPYRFKCLTPPEKCNQTDPTVHSQGLIGCGSMGVPYIRRHPGPREGMQRAEGPNMQRCTRSRTMLDNYPATL